MSEFSDLQCGLSNDHIVRGPISLICSHSICKKCVSDQVKIQCRICNEETDKSNLQMNKESALVKNSINVYLDYLMIWNREQLMESIHLKVRFIF